MFDKCAIDDHLLERFLGDKVVMFPVDLSGTWRAGRIWIKGSAVRTFLKIADLVPYERR